MTESFAILQRFCKKNITINHKGIYCKTFESYGNLKRGFTNAEVMVIESKTASTCHIGTCVLLQDPTTWGKNDKCNTSILKTLQSYSAQ